MPRFDSATGRYTYLTIDDAEYRLYFEEAGTGEIGLLLQHTAGADGRQWRHIMEDDYLGSKFRLIAYDLPYHGKSVPPADTKWWEEEYRLEKEFLMQSRSCLRAPLNLIDPSIWGVPLAVT